MVDTQSIVRRVGQPGGLPWAGLGHLGVLYVVWGSTYVAMRFAVGRGGFPPFALGAVRVGAAGLVLWATCALAGRGARPGRHELARLSVSGVLWWVLGHGLMLRATVRAGSGTVALCVAALPIWVLAIEAALDRRAPAPRTLLGVAIGLGGIAVLYAPRLSGGAADWRSLACALGGGAATAAAIVLQRRRPSRMDPIASSAWQHLLAAPVFAAVSIALGEGAPRPTGAGLWAAAYLTVFGSVVAFTSFVHALRLLPTRVVTTYSLVNPLVAVATGALLLGEVVDVPTVVGAALVLCAVALALDAGPPRSPSSTDEAPGATAARAARRAA